MVCDEQGGGKRRLCIDGSTGHVEETSLEGSPKSQFHGVGNPSWSNRFHFEELWSKDEECGVYDYQKMSDIFLDFYHRLFSSDLGSMVTEIFDAMKKHVSQMTQCALNLDFIGDEIEAALQSMAPTKSPGPIGIPALFYRKYWDVVRGDVCQLCLNVLNGCDSVVTTFETIHYLKRWGKARRHKLMLKLDMEKAYD
ncbi:unnamed protein product [Prunus brigantina]